jgi:hypothetical protein
LIEKGLVSGDAKMRESFISAIRFIVESIKSPQLSEQPFKFFIRLLLSKLDYVQHKAVSRHTKLYFSLVRELLPIYFDSQTGLQAANS